MSEKRLIISKDIADFLKNLSIVSGSSNPSYPYLHFMNAKHINDSLQARAKHVLTEYQQDRWSSDDMEFIKRNEFALTTLAKWPGEVKVIHLQLDYYSIGLSNEVQLEETRYITI